MSNLVKRPWLLLPLLILTLQSSWGQAPSGPITFNFNSASTAVYDLSGTYNFDQDIIAVGNTPQPLSFQGVVLTHDRSGRLYGKGYITVAIGSDSAVAAYYTATGHVSGGGNNPVQVRLNIHLSGNDVVAGVQTRFSITVNYNWQVDPNSMALVGPAKGRASFAKLSGARIDTQVMTVPLQPGVDGTWTANLDVQPLGHLGGTGNLTLSNGRTLPVHLNGNYIPVSGLSRVQLNGFYDGNTDGRGSLVRMGYFSDLSIQTVNGQILGQRVVQ